MSLIRALALRCDQLERRLEEAGAGLTKIRELIGAVEQALSQEREALNRERALFYGSGADAELRRSEPMRAAADAYFARQKRIMDERKTELIRLRDTEALALTAVQTLFAEKERLRILSENIQAEAKAELEAKRAAEMEEILLLRMARAAAKPRQPTDREHNSDEAP